MCVNQRQPEQIVERGTPSDGAAVLLRIKAATVGKASLLCERQGGTGDGLRTLFTN